MYEYMSPDGKIRYTMFFDSGITESSPTEILDDRMADISETLADFEIDEEMATSKISGFDAATVSFNAGEGVDVTHVRLVAVMTGPKEAFVAMAKGSIDDREAIATSWSSFIQGLSFSNTETSGGGGN